MNAVIENIKTRRSVRSYKPDMPEKELIDTVIDAGLNAASGRNLQSPIIIAVTDKATRDRLSLANAAVMSASGDPFYGAPVILVVLASKTANTAVYDGSITLGNMMLAAHSLGLGSCWIHRAKEVFEQPEWKQWLKDLGIEGDYEGVGNLILGYAEGGYPAEKERKADRVFYIN